MNLKRFTLFLLFVIACAQSIFATDQYQQRHHDSKGGSIIKGRITSSDDNSPIPYATVFIEDTNIGTTTDEKGRFIIKTPVGKHKLGVSCVGYENYLLEVVTKHHDSEHIQIKLTPSQLEIDQVLVRGESSSARLNKTAYNVQSLSLEGIKNSSASMTDALKKMGGVKIRETGGVGSDANISLNGFSGNHVKIFIDGIALDNNNSSFSLSNMPASFAERIDVYSGVVPIEFGTDAIGGVINIVSNKTPRINTTNLDASYSYGSFNTHSTYINFGQTRKSGFIYNINLYQNYSDNDYWIDTPVATLNEGYGGYPIIDNSDKTEYRVRRFNDAYHNETAIASLGLVDKSWADVLSLKFNYSQYDKEIQTGTIQEYVYGQKERSGHSFTPTLDYSKNDLLTEGLSLKISANYTWGYTHNFDPGGLSYNWRGESIENRNVSSQDSEQKSESYTANLVSKYILSERSAFTLSNTLTASSRISRSMETESSKYTEWQTPKRNMKNIAGLSYRYAIASKFDATAFAKYYTQLNRGEALNSAGDIEIMTNSASSLGYGAALSYFFIDGLQTKLSYEKAYRLPTVTEIFGDEDLEVGTFTLKPESSDNYNLNLIYGLELAKKHHITIDGTLIYRDTRDYIIRSVSGGNVSSSAGYTNFGRVKTEGYTLSLRYNYDRLFNLGATFSDISPRNAEKALHEGTEYETVTYGVRLPNTPYRYANADAAFNLYDVFEQSDVLTLSYSMFYQYEFSLYWENLGDESKPMVPTQLAHNVSLNYSLKNGKYNISLDAKNITDARLYDNYSLQKAGRAFYVKLRIKY